MPAIAQEAALATAPDAAPADDLVVTLLGTGTPALHSDRFSSANLVQAGGLNLLFDAGRGATIRIKQAGLNIGQIDATFLTNFHSDHVNGLADVFMTGYIRVPYIGTRQEPFQLYGPIGTQKLADGLRMTHQWDIDTRILDEQIPEPATRIEAHESESGVVFEQNGVKVTAFPVKHGDKIENAIGYRIDYGDKSVLISGDTTFDQNVVEFGRDTDLVIHEVGMAVQDMMDSPAVQTALAHHTSPEDVGRVFAAAQPDFAVYSHMVLMGNPPVDELITRTRTTYDGPLVIGKDLMQFRLSDQGTSIQVLKE
ncbi:MBL fold metallo-hydrolase [Paracoccus sp. M683]|nr:MBL fold metallo-hydrolase [Paracoccus sp. M683]